MISKVWLHTFWLAWGEIQAAPQIAEGVQPVVQKAWLQAVAPPYYRGTGIALRLGRNTLRIGVCYPLGQLTRPDTDAEIEAALFSRRIDKTEEGRWDSEDRSA